MDRELFKKITAVPGMENASDDDIKRFLEVISDLETSKGKYTDHKPASFGVSKGDIAEGDYGLMPKTKQELLKRFKGVSEEELPTKLGEMLLNKNEGDQDASSVGWRFGHNLSPEKMSERKDESYPKAFKDKMDTLMEEQSNIPQSLSKYDYSKLKVLLGK